MTNIYVFIIFTLLIILLMGMGVSKGTVTDTRGTFRQLGGRPKQSPVPRNNASDVKLIPDVSFSSNNDKIDLNDNYSSKFASLSDKRSWAGNPQLRYISYLQIDMPRFYHINGIVTKGRSGAKEWVTRYLVEYWDKYQENWVKYPQILPGNNNDNQPMTNSVDFSTDKIRIYPVRWIKRPSLRVGLIGEKAHFSSCRYYKAKIGNLSNESEKAYYQKLYDKSCLKVSKRSYDAVLDNLRMNKRELMQNMSKIEKLEKRREELDELQKQCCVIAKELKRVKDSSCPREQLIDLANRYRNIVETKEKALTRVH